MDLESVIQSEVSQKEKNNISFDLTSRNHDIVKILFSLNECGNNMQLGINLPFPLLHLGL